MYCSWAHREHLRFYHSRFFVTLDPYLCESDGVSKWIAVTLLCPPAFLYHRFRGTVSSHVHTIFSFVVALFQHKCNSLLIIFIFIIQYWLRLHSPLSNSLVERPSFQPRSYRKAAARTRLSTSSFGIASLLSANYAHVCRGSNLRIPSTASTLHSNQGNESFP